MKRLRKFSLCYLSVLCASVVIDPVSRLHHRDTENAKITQRKPKKRSNSLRRIPALVFAILLLPVGDAQNQRPTNQQPELPKTLGLDQGYLELDTPDFTLKLVKASQTVAALLPKTTTAFDFTPADRLERRAANGFHHLGDLTLRMRR